MKVEDCKLKPTGLPSWPTLPSTCSQREACPSSGFSCVVEACYVAEDRNALVHVMKVNGRVLKDSLELRYDHHILCSHSAPHTWH